MLLPIKPGTKKAEWKGWQRLRLIDTAGGTYREKLCKSPAIAVLLGPPSRDLIAIDFDRAEAAADFLALNPAFAESLRTHGSRGCSLWAIMGGPYPARVISLTDENGAALGEWRGGGGCYSLIAGEHPDGHAYTVLNQAPPVAILFESIQWPGHWRSIPTLNCSESDAPGTETEVIGCGSRAKHNRSRGSPDEQRGRRDQGDREAGAIQKTASSIGYDGRRGVSSETQSKPTQTESLYDCFIEFVWTAAPGKRNEFIVKAVPFLFHAMCEPAVMALVMRYYDLNHHHFKDSRETHRAEASEHLRNVADRFHRSLTPRERRIYDGFQTEKRRAALRICRHLSKHKSNRHECDEGEFFLSFADLGARLLIDPKGARKLMLALVKQNVVEIVRKGERWKKGHRARATWWRYLL